MRIGDNPNKINSIKTKTYVHQVIIPVYIPNEEGYFKDSFKIFQLCTQSLLSTTHQDTYITIVNNGSCDKVVNYLNNLLKENKIQELIHTTNIGKINAVLKGLVGVDASIVTVSDQDILFQENWQAETLDIFDNFENAGVVGLIPMVGLHKVDSENTIASNLFSNRLKFRGIKNPEAIIKFYDSIWTNNNYTKNNLSKMLTLSSENGKITIVGSGHLVASYRKSIFLKLEATLTDELLSSNSDRSFLDLPPLKLGYYRLTTYDNYAFHMGNTFENWMDKLVPKCKSDFSELAVLSKPIFHKNKLLLKMKFFMKYAFVKKIVFNKILYKYFLRLKDYDKQL